MKDLVRTQVEKERLHEGNHIPEQGVRKERMSRKK